MRCWQHNAKAQVALLSQLLERPCGAESAMYAEGLRLAVLTSFIRLLELREDELEDVQKGTGSLDSDLKLLQV